jgi:hypothetical protein
VADATSLLNLGGGRRRMTSRKPRFAPFASASTDAFGGVNEEGGGDLELQKGPSARVSVAGLKRSEGAEEGPEAPF